MQIKGYHTVGAPFFVFEAQLPTDGRLAIVPGSGGFADVFENSWAAFAFDLVDR
jgi:aspartokinase-like uncharacterized kinase